jgi:hypothetical protein
LQTMSAITVRGLKLGHERFRLPVGHCMTIAEAAQLITSIAALIAAVASVRNGRKLNVQHQSMNSRMDELIETTRREAHAAGIKQEQERGDAA